MTRIPMRRRTTDGAFVRAVGYVAAAALTVSAVWYGLLATRVTVADPPTPAAGQSIDSAMHRFYEWFATTVVQERFDLAVAIGGAVCLGLVALNLARLFDRGEPAALVGAYAIGIGGAIWSIGSLVQLGGHRAVGLMATHGNPIQTVNAIDFTVDTIDETFELTAVILLGLGLLAFVSAASRKPVAGSAWSTYTFASGLTMLALAVSYVVGTDDVTTWLLVVAGAAVIPMWIVWTARLSPVVPIPSIEAEDATATRERTPLRDQVA
jgi:hypothetical protein